MKFLVRQTSSFGGASGDAELLANADRVREAGDSTLVRDRAIVAARKVTVRLPQYQIGGVAGAGG